MNISKIIAILLLFASGLCYAELALNCGKDRVLLFSEKNGCLLAIRDKEIRTHLSCSNLGLWAAEGCKGKSIACASQAKFSWDKESSSEYIFRYVHPKANVVIRGQ